jgi:hypothetical protein
LEGVGEIGGGFVKVLVSEKMSKKCCCGMFGELRDVGIGRESKHE